MGRHFKERPAPPARPLYPGAYFRLGEALSDKRGMKLTDFGLSEPRALLATFAARFRLASTFAGVSLPGYSVGTVEGYSVFMRAFLIYSAVEKYAKLSGDSPETLLDTAAGTAVFNKCFDRELAWEGLHLIRTRTTGARVRAELQLILDRKSTSVSAVLKAWRHAFVHGDLAPGASDQKPGVLDALARRAKATILPYALLRLDEDLTQRVDRQLGVGERAV